MITADTAPRRDHSFMMGLVTGTFVGAGLAIWFAPRIATEIRQRLTDSAKAMTDSARLVSDRASEGYRQVSTRVGDTFDDFTARSRAVRDDMADAVVRGAHEVERVAIAVKTDRGASARTATIAD
jgi:gas vesicle protein